MHLAAWSDSLGPDSTSYEEPLPAQEEGGAAPGPSEEPPPDAGREDGEGTAGETGR
jgi:hypothetical protein